jgi:hypothetical protein
MIRSGSFPKPGITLMTPKYSNAAAPANIARKAMPKYTGVLEDFPSNRGMGVRSDIGEVFIVKFYQSNLYKAVVRSG